MTTLRRMLPFVWVLIVSVAPMLWLIYTSLGEGWHFPNLTPDRFSVAAWQQISGGTLGESLFTSALLATLTAASATALGFWTGQHVAYHRHRIWLLRLIYVPFVASPVMLGTSLLFLMIKLQLSGTFIGVWLVHLMLAYAFAMLFFEAFWTPRIQALIQLVYTLGGSRGQVFRRVLLPVAAPAIGLCFFQTFLLSWFQYGITLMIGSGRVNTLPIQVFAYVSEANPTFAATAAVLLTAPPLLLLALNKRLFMPPWPPD